MITIFLILCTWYATKIYYTRSITLSLYDLEKHGFIHAKCSKCSQNIIIPEEHMRTPFYCSVCK
jgi:hypothetical protein